MVVDIIIIYSVDMADCVGDSTAENMRAPTVDEMNRLMQWMSRAYAGRIVADITFGATPATVMFLKKALKDPSHKRRLSICEILAMSYNHATSSVEIDCALAAILLKAYAADDATMVDFFPAVEQVPGNKATAVTTTMTEDSHCTLRTDHSLIFTVQWIVPLTNNNGAVEWWGYTQKGFRIAPSKETWGALMVTIHQDLRLSPSSALQVTLKHHWNYTEKQLQYLPSARVTVIHTHSILAYLYANEFEGFIDAVYK